MHSGTSRLRALVAWCGGMVCGVVVLAAVLLSGCSSGRASEPAKAVRRTPHSVGTIKQVMHILDPSADAVWGSVGTIVAASGTEERAPKTDEEWNALILHAITVAEAGNLLMLPGRGFDNDAWPERAYGLVAAGTEVANAAQNRDADGVLKAGEHLIDACNQCHSEFWPAWHDTDIAK